MKEKEVENLVFWIGINYESRGLVNNKSFYELRWVSKESLRDAWDKRDVPLITTKELIQKCKEALNIE